MAPKKYFIFLTVLLMLSLASAVTINSVFTDTLAPGKEGTIEIEVDNILNDDVTDVSLSLQFNDTPFIPVGTSEQSADEIQEGEDEDFFFTIKASNTVEPGNYEIPFTISYELNGDVKTKTGTIGIQVDADPELSFTAATENPIVDEQGQITLRIINKGFFNARFVSIKVLPEDFTLLSESEAYIGEVESDDFESQSFDVLFTKTNPTFRAIVTYKDFENNDKIQEIEIPLTVYTRERALELGIIQPTIVIYYIIGVVVLIILIILWRYLRKRQRLKKSQRLKEES